MTTPLLQIDLRDRRTGAVTRHTFTRGPIRIGRDPANELCLADATVSAFHAVVDVDPAGARLRDLGSKNGLLIAGRRSIPHATITITRRLCVELGPYHLEFAHRPNPDRRAAHGALPSSAAPDLDALHALLARLHTLHEPLVAARRTFESALADAALALADDPAAARRLLAEFPAHDHAHLLLDLPSSTAADPFQIPPLTAQPPAAPLDLPLPLFHTLHATPPPDLPQTPDPSHPPTHPHDLSQKPSHPHALPPPDLSHPPATPTPQPHDLSHPPATPTPQPPDLSHPPATPTPRPHDLSHPPATPTPRPHDLSHPPAPPTPQPPDLSHPPAPPTPRPHDLSHPPATPTPQPPALRLLPSDRTPPLRLVPPELPPAPALRLLAAPPDATLAALALIAPLARAALPGDRPPASLDEARRFLDRVSLVLRDLAAGVAALQHVRRQQTRSFDLAAAGPENPALDLSRGDDLLARLLAWREPETRAHELSDCFAVLLAHLRAQAHAALSTACHFAAALAPPEIERRTRTRGPLRTRALWRAYQDRYRDCVGEVASPVLKDTFTEAYRSELAELGVQMIPRKD